MNTKSRGDLIVGIDTGGTFTDLFMVDLATQRFVTNKVDSTPSDPSLAFMNALHDTAEPGVNARKVIHGTTHATNTIIQKRGVPVGLITTAGFRDVLEIARSNRPFDHVYDLQWRRPRPLVPRYLRVGVPERTDSRGDVTEELDEEALLEAVRYLNQHEVRALAVCFLFSYLNDEHEKKAARLIREHFPQLDVSLSSAILPEWREYERTCAAVADAFIKPIMKGYFSRLEHALTEWGYQRPLLIMKSNGGVMSTKIACDYPIQTYLSGPAAGLVAARAIGHTAGYGNLITMDMGGTSFDVGLIQEGEFGYTTEAEIDAGVPIKLAMIDIRTIGAGGGSIGWVDSGGALRVGPQSAGADPGPACYGIGGAAPTVTDANLFLGRLNPAYFLGGKRNLDVDRARSVIEELASHFNLSPVDTARGILTVGVANMVEEIRAITAENGYDPREFVLAAFGGAGPLHAAAIARELEIKRVLIPRYPGLLCGAGLIIADLKFDTMRTFRCLVEREGIEQVKRYLKEMLAEGQDLLRAEGYQDPPILVSSVDMRYVGQNFEITLSMDLQHIVGDDLCASFDSEHERLYGFSNRSEMHEIVRLRTTIIGQSKEHELVMNILCPRSETHLEGAASAGASEVRLIYGESGDTPEEASIHRRSELQPGQAFSGPALVEEESSTTYIPSGAYTQIDAFGNMTIDL
jgi:N-methylhydantoinase A